jgi:heme exporter protein C
MMRKALDIGLPVLALLGLIAGGFMGLNVAPEDRDMGDVYRIMFVHVPAAWTTLIAFTVTFVASLVYMFKTSYKADALGEASAEIGVFFGILTMVLGSIWGKPTWDVWWTWDPRLTSTAVVVFSFAGYLALRQFVDDPERRATWSGVAGILIFIGVPVIWFSVKWWGGLHQVQSNTGTMQNIMTSSLRLNAIAFLLLYFWFLRLRYQVALRRLEHELTEPPELEETK